LKIHEYWNVDNKIKQQLIFQLVEVLLLSCTGFAELDIILLCMLCMFLTRMTSIFCIVSMVSVIFCMFPITIRSYHWIPRFEQLSLSLPSLSLSLSAAIMWTLADFLNDIPFIGRLFSKGAIWLADYLPVCCCIIVVFTGVSGSTSISSR
jgi:hypothetical protein